MSPKDGKCAQTEDAVLLRLVISFQEAVVRQEWDNDGELKGQAIRNRVIPVI